MSSKNTAARDPYLVKSVVHSSQLLSAFRTSGEALPLREISARSGLPKSMAFRLLYTLERCGMIEKVGENLYRSHIRPFKQKPFRLGYAAQGTDYQFSKEVSVGLQRAAATHGVELICVDNRYNPKIAQRNAEVLVREKVDLVIEFQTDEHVAATVAAKYRDAEIPLIALEVPHPGATYFGANNYEAGLIGGRHLGRWAKQCWHSEVDEIIMIALERAGSLPKMRLTGMLVGMKEICPQLENCRVTYVDGDGKLGESFEAIRRHLRVSKAAGRGDQRPQRARRTPRLPGGRPQRFLRRHGTERRARGTRRASPARNPADRLRCVLPREVRRGDPRARARHPAPPPGASGNLREAPARHPGERRSHLPERSAASAIRGVLGKGQGRREKTFPFSLVASQSHILSVGPLTHVREGHRPRSEKAL
jgi:ribose transport system substrate-binding protein